MRRQRDILDADYSSNTGNATDQRNRWSSAVNCLNWLSIILLILGIVSFSLFAGCNLAKEIGS